MPTAALVKGLKNALKGGKKGVSLQPSFGQFLGDCPMSSENKVCGYTTTCIVSPNSNFLPGSPICWSNYIRNDNGKLVRKIQELITIVPVYLPLSLV